MLRKTLCMLMVGAFLGMAGLSGALGATITEPNGAVVKGKVTIIVKKAHKKPRKHRHKHKKRKTLSLHSVHSGTSGTSITPAKTVTPAPSEKLMKAK